MSESARSSFSSLLSTNKNIKNISSGSFLKITSKFDDCIGDEELQNFSFS